MATGCAPAYPNAILVLPTEDASHAIPGLPVTIAPDAENGCRKPRARPDAAPLRVMPEQLAAIRGRIAPGSMERESQQKRRIRIDLLPKP
jgi:hypothetical protein